MVQVLIRSEQDRQLINTPLDLHQTVGTLKDLVSQTLGLQSTDGLKVFVRGEECSDQQKLSEAGVDSGDSKTTIQAAGLQVFPNNWFDSPYAKTFAKVLDITWPPVRQADYTVGWIWVAAVAAALIAVNTLLGS